MPPKMQSFRVRTALVMLFAVGTGLAATACSSSSGSSSAGGKVTISVDCEPPTSQASDRKIWTDDVAAFEKQNPKITINSKDAFPCDTPATFNAELKAGKMANVFYMYFTDTQNVIKTGEAADISKYANLVPNLKDITPPSLSFFKDSSGKLYGLPRENYQMGLLYNRTLFQRAGLDPNSPPTTWADVQADAKKIAALGKGYVGYADYSANSQGGWHFTAETYSQGGSVVSPDGKKAAFNSPQGQAVLNNLKQMRWTDNSMGTKQLLQIPDVESMMAAGKLGMYLSAPDNLPDIVQKYQGHYQDYGMGPMPGQQATLLGGDGYMFNAKDTPAQIQAGIKWLVYQNLTVGQGIYNYQEKAATKTPVGLPQPAMFTLGTPSANADDAAKAKYANVPIANFKPFITTTPTLKSDIEPPDAQAVYSVLDGVMSKVLTDRNANVNQLLSNAESQVNSVLANQQ
jgi:multiple sugar transport system substrate-binding protein